MLLSATVEAYRVSLVEPVAYLSDSYVHLERTFTSPTKCALRRTKARRSARDGSGQKGAVAICTSAPPG
jgi:hypothetical protein